MRPGGCAKIGGSCWTWRCCSCEMLRLRCDSVAWTQVGSEAATVGAASPSDPDTERAERAGRGDYTGARVLTFTWRSCSQSEWTCLGSPVPFPFSPMILSSFSCSAQMLLVKL